MHIVAQVYDVHGVISFNCIVATVEVFRMDDCLLKVQYVSLNEFELSMNERLYIMKRCKSFEQK